LFQRLFTLFVALIAFSCFSSSKYQQELKISTISFAQLQLSDLNCVDMEAEAEVQFSECFKELNKLMKSMRGIKDYEMWVEVSHQIILINIVYNNKKTTIDKINDRIRSNGYTVVLEMKE